MARLYPGGSLERGPPISSPSLWIMEAQELKDEDQRAATEKSRVILRSSMKLLIRNKNVKNWRNNYSCRQWSSQRWFKDVCSLIQHRPEFSTDSDMSKYSTVFNEQFIRDGDNLLWRTELLLSVKEWQYIWKCSHLAVWIFNPKSIWTNDIYIQITNSNIYTHQYLANNDLHSI